MDDNFKKEVWLSSSIILASFAVFGIFFSWVAGDLHARADQVSQSRLLIAHRARSIEVLAKLKESDKDVEDYQKLMYMILPTQDELFDFNRKMEEIGSVNRVSLTSQFQPGGDSIPSSDVPGTVGFKFDVSGAYNNLVNFFRAIEGGDTRYLISVDSLDALGTAEGFSMKSRARVFYRPSQ